MIYPILGEKNKIGNAAPSPVEIDVTDGLKIDLKILFCIVNMHFKKITAAVILYSFFPIFF